MWLPATAPLPLSGLYVDSGNLGRWLGVAEAGSGYTMKPDGTARDSEGLDVVWRWQMSASVTLLHALDATTRAQIENGRGWLLFVPRRRGTWMIPDTANTTALPLASGVIKPSSSLASKAVLARWILEESHHYGDGAVVRLGIQGNAVGARGDFERTISYYF